jgi:hypothetical protein
MRLIISGLLLLACSHYAAADSYTRFEQNGKIGLKDETGLIVIPAVYDALGWSNGSFSVTNKVTGYKLKGAWGVLNLNNERVTSPLYSALTVGDGSLLVASKQSQALKISTGCIGTNGEIVIPFEYTGVTQVHSLRIVAFVRDGNAFKHGLIDLENKVLIPFQYRNIYPIGTLRYAVEDFKGKIALFSENGRQISGFTIDSISHFNSNLAVLYEAGKKGLINREGELVSEAKYRDIQISQNVVKVRMPDEWHVLKANNATDEIIGADSIVSLSEKRFKIGNAGIVKLVDENLKPISDEIFSDVSQFKNGLAIFQSANRYGVLKKNGKSVLKAQFQKIILSDDYILTLERSTDKLSWSLRDTLGRKLHSKTYEQILDKQSSIFPVMKNGYWGAINSKGIEIVACVYDSILEIADNQLAVKFKGQYGIISLKEEWLAYPQPNPVRLINQDRYWKQVDKTIFLCSFKGTVLYFTINRIEMKDTHFIEYIHPGGTWTIDFDGRIINRQLPPDEPAEKIFPSTEGLRGIKKNGKFGFIDDQGRLRVANRYENIMPFSEGLAAIKIRNKWGFINRDEKIIIQPVYEDVKPFEKGYSLVKQNG